MKTRLTEKTGVSAAQADHDWRLVQRARWLLSTDPRFGQKTTEGRLLRLLHAELAGVALRLAARGDQQAGDD